MNNKSNFLSLEDGNQILLINPCTTPYLNSNCVAKLGPSLTNNLSWCPQFGRGVIKFPVQAEIRDKRHGHLSNLNNAWSYNLRFRDKGRNENRDVANIFLDNLTF